MQSVSITTKVVSSYPIPGKVYLIQHYVIRFVSDLRQVDGFLWVYGYSYIVMEFFEGRINCLFIVEIVIKKFVHATTPKF